MYYRIGETKRSAYLNDKEYVENEIKSLNTYINTTETYIDNNDEELNNLIHYKTLSEKGKKT